MPSEEPSDLPKDHGFLTVLSPNGSKTGLAKLMPHLAKKAIEMLVDCGLYLDKWDFLEPQWFLMDCTKAVLGFGWESN